jgi:hypothetical protein
MVRTATMSLSKLLLKPLLDATDAALRCDNCHCAGRARRWFRQRRPPCGAAGGGLYRADPRVGLVCSAQLPYLQSILAVRTAVLQLSKGRRCSHTTMRLPLIGKNRPIFIGILRLFWIYFYRLMGNAYYKRILVMEIRCGRRYPTIVQGIAGLVRIPYTSGISDELCCENADFAKTSSGQLRERNGNLV